ncbi:hypothetical protein ACSBL2_17040 [Pedobacter sp. AW31-3R]|uniref:hypothetical protein n=1 Tax=Pedobacter sp. AW31-3R TaxID=3445781 RepID=UPI003F9F9232
MNIEELLRHIVGEQALHARFLNTLSLQENIGARKISASELPETTTYMVLKHAAEEHRHAYYLKKQVAKLSPGQFLTYEPDYLLAPRGSRLYLNKLDLETSRYLKNTLRLTGADLKFGAYLLVTYAIEVRADYLYPIYQQVLNEVKSTVSVRNIIVEEQGHLEEMIEQLKRFSSDWEHHAKIITLIEERLYHHWITDLGSAVHYSPKF